MFWDNFYNICKAKGTTPNAICKEVGLSNSVATNWKNGTMPKADVLLKISELLDCSTDYLLGRTDESDTVISENKSLSNDSGLAEIETIISKLSGASRYRAIADVLEVLEKYA